MLLNYEKQGKVYTSYAHLPLTARPLDLLYFIFFAVHIPATLLIDLQYIYPAELVPSILRGLLDYYVDKFRDPLIGGIFGAYGDSKHLSWFKTFIVMEAFFQLPVFIYVLRPLYFGSRSIYPLLAIYGASSATTTLACIVTVLQTADLTSQTISSGTASVTPQQRLVLLASYVPFFIVQFIMAVDVSFRMSTLVEKGIKAEEDEKWK